MTDKRKKEVITAGIVLAAVIATFPGLAFHAIWAGALVNIYWVWEV